MSGKFLHTSDLARAVGIHPNTVRLYVEWGLIPPVQRGPTEYRLFTQRHLDCLRLARLVYATEYPGKALRFTAHAITQAAVAGDWESALEKANNHRLLVRAEIDYAETAVKLLEQWAERPQPETTEQQFSISEAAKLLDVTQDVLRNWERNGLISIPRNPSNGYRLFGQQEISRLRIIRILSRAGYSLMAILRMFIELDGGNNRNLRQALDTPRPDEDIFTAADHWLSTLYGQEKQMDRIIQLIEEQLSFKNQSEQL